MRLYVFAVGLLAFVTACGGGGGGGGNVSPGLPPSNSGATPTAAPTHSPTPPPTPLPSPTSTATTATTSILVGTQATSAALPSVGSFTETLQVPPANAPGTVSVTVSTNEASGLPPLTGGDTGLLYFTLSSSSGVTFYGLPGVTVSLAPGVSTTRAFYLAGYSVPNWSAFAGPAAPQGNDVSIPSSTGTFSISTGMPELFVFYSATPISATPGNVQLLSTSATQLVTMGDSVPGSQLSLDATACKGIVNTTLQSATTFLVSGVAVGTCSLKISDNHGNSLATPVSVTSTTVIIQ